MNLIIKIKQKIHKKHECDIQKCIVVCKHKKIYTVELCEYCTKCGKIVSNKWLPTSTEIYVWYKVGMPIFYSKVINPNKINLNKIISVSELTKYCKR